MVVPQQKYWQIVRQLHKSMDDFLESLTANQITDLLNAKLQVEIQLRPLLQLGLSRPEVSDKPKSKKQTRKKQSRIKMKSDDISDTVKALYRASGRAEIQKILRRKRKDELLQIMEELALDSSSGDTVKTLKEKIITATVLARKDTQAIITS